MYKYCRCFVGRRFYFETAAASHISAYLTPKLCSSLPWADTADRQWMQIHYLFTKTTKAKNKKKINQHTTEPTDNFIYIICKVGCAFKTRRQKRQWWETALGFCCCVVVAPCRNAGSHSRYGHIFVVYSDLWAVVQLFLLTTNTCETWVNMQTKHLKTNLI